MHDSFSSEQTASGHYPGMRTLHAPAQVTELSNAHHLWDQKYTGIHSHLFVYHTIIFLTS